MVENKNRNKSDNLGGRPKKLLDERQWAVLNALIEVGTPKTYIASKLDVNVLLIDARIRDAHNCSYEEYREMKMESVKAALKRTIINKALKGDNTALIFSLKNLCGWSDNKQNENNSNQPTISLTDVINALTEREKKDGNIKNGEYKEKDEASENRN